MFIADKRKIIEKEFYDVVVVGGGIAGISAAVSAARNGAKTLLLEKQINLGGLATVGLISWYEPLCDGMGKQMISGIAEELITLSIKYGFENLPEKWGGEGKNAIHYDRYATRYSPTLFALALDEFVEESGADIRFDSLATYPVMNNNICEGIVVESASGKEFFPAKIVIDATGDASISKNAGLPVSEGLNWVTYICHGFDNEKITEYTKNNDLCAFRSWIACGGDMYGRGNIAGVSQKQGVTSEDINEFIKIGKRAMLEKYKSSPKDSRDIMMLPTMPQYRKIRHIQGEYDFTGNEDGVKFDDAIGSCGDFRKCDKHFQIPYRTLYNGGFPNILTAGRIISASDDGWEITRVIPICALTGQSAGTAAAHCVKNNCFVNEIDIVALRKTLKNQKVII